MLLDFIIGTLYTWLGWQVTGTIPYHLKKGMWVVSPHISNWDFFIGLFARHNLGIYIGYLGKSTLFTWYASWFFKYTGGYPVNRRKATNLVEAVANTFAQNESIHIAITPEGTRNDVKTLKTGFYYMALRANVPIVSVGFELKNRKMVVGPVIYPTGNYKEDMKPYYDFSLTLNAPRKQWLKDYAETGIIPDPSDRK